jgi:peptide/nickel transport system ATP-binding protein
MKAQSDKVLTVEGLKTHFFTDDGQVPAVDGVSFSMRRGQVLAIVGESGSGKSVTAYSILRLIQKPGRIIDGRICLHKRDGEDVDITALPDNADMLYNIRGGLISMIFQEPMTALSPVHSVGDQVSEAIKLHQNVTNAEAEARVVEMLGKVGIPSPETRIKQYPFEMSGGMRQRVVIAMAMVCKPEILIADEPTTALDVTIQAQILKLMKDIQQDMGTSILLITHDLAVVAQVADDVAVMYLGRIIEQADVRQAMKSPRHPYTEALIKSLPGLTLHHESLPTIKGSVPSFYEMPKGCPFHPRCSYAKKGLCDTGAPPPLQPAGDGRMSACLRWKEVFREDDA